MKKPQTQIDPGKAAVGAVVILSALGSALLALNQNEVIKLGKAKDHVHSATRSLALSLVLAKLLREAEKK